MDLQDKRALVRLLEAYVDLRTARALARNLPSRSLFHSQQAAEKALKAALSKVIIGDIKIHPVLKLLKEKVIPILPNPLRQLFVKIESDIFWLERRWIDTRYEEVTPKGTISTPLFNFNLNDARKGIVIAQEALEWSRKCMEEQYGLKIPKSYFFLSKMVQQELQGKEEKL